MKKYFIIAVAAVVAMAACTKVETDGNVPGKRISFQVANYASQTKAAEDPGSVLAEPSIPRHGSTQTVLQTVPISSELTPTPSPRPSLTTVPMHGIPNLSTSGPRVQTATSTSFPGSQPTARLLQQCPKLL